MNLEKLYIQNFIENLIKKNHIDCDLVFVSEILETNPTGVMSYEPISNVLEVYIPNVEKLQPLDGITSEERLLFFTAHELGHFKHFERKDAFIPFNLYVKSQDTSLKSTSDDERYELEIQTYKSLLELEIIGWILGKKFISFELVPKYNEIALQHIEGLITRTKEHIKSTYPSKDTKFIKRIFGIFIEEHKGVLVEYDMDC